MTVNLPELLDVINRTDELMNSGINDTLALLEHHNISGLDVRDTAHLYKVSERVALAALVIQAETFPHEAEIIFMERDEARNKAPMWRCFAADNRRINIFETVEGEGLSLFKDAGYGVAMTRMQVGDKADWVSNPIRVTLHLVRGWWAVSSVESRYEDKSAPDNVVNIFKEKSGS